MRKVQFTLSRKMILGKLFVTNEAGEEYEIELATQRVKKKSSNHSKTSILQYRKV